MSKQNQWIVGVNAVASAIENDADNVREVLVEGGSKNARLTDLTLGLDDSKITGNFAIEGFDDPAFKFALAVDAVDADRYLPPKKRDAQAGEATAGDLTLTDTDTVTEPNIPSIRLGQVVDSTGNLTMSGGTVFIDGPVGSGFAIGDLMLGDNGTGSMTMTGGDDATGSEPASTLMRKRCPSLDGAYELRTPALES